MRAANRAKGLPPETGTGDLRNERARRKAVELLGLPEGNTAADRAAAMGFDTDAYHGTNREFSEFDALMRGAKTGAPSARKAEFSVSDPEVSNTYVSLHNVHPYPWEPVPVYKDLVDNPQAFAEFNAATTKEEKFRVLEKYGMNYGGGKVLPLKLNLGKQRVVDYKGAWYRDTSYNDEIKRAKKAGKDSVVFKNTYDPGPHQGYRPESDVFATFNPANIRSRFAAFDPARRNEADLLAGLLPYAIPAGLLGLLTLPREEYQ